MTNRKKYKKQIDKVISSYIEERHTKPIDEVISTHIAMVRGRIKRCSICTPCGGCDFHKMNTDGIDCKEFTRKWLDEEVKK